MLNLIGLHQFFIKLIQNPNLGMLHSNWSDGTKLIGSWTALPATASVDKLGGPGQARPINPDATKATKAKDIPNLSGKRVAITITSL